MSSDQLIYLVMSEQNPIEIPSDNEEQEKFIQKVIKLDQAFDLYQAHMVSNLEVMFTVEKFNLSDDKHEAAQKLQAEIKQYFSDIIDISQENFSPRREPDPNDEQVDNAIILFGVDFLSNKNIRPMFEGLEPKITWLDSSQCKITFNSHEDAKAGIARNLCETGEMEEEDGLWKRLKSYEILTFPRSIMCRFATTGDSYDGDRKSPKYNEFKDREAKYKAELVAKNKPQYERYIKELGLSKMGVCGPIISRNLRKPRRPSGEFDRERRGYRDFGRDERSERGRNNFERRRDNFGRDYSDRGGRDRDNFGRDNYERRDRNFNREDDYRQRSREKYSRNNDRDERRERSRSASSRSNSSENNYDFVLPPQAGQCSQNNQVDLNISKNMDISFQNDSLPHNESNKLDLSMSEEEPMGQNEDKEDINKLNISIEMNQSLDYSQKNKKESPQRKNKKKKGGVTSATHNRSDGNIGAKQQQFKQKEEQKSQNRNNFRPKGKTDPDANWKFKDGRERVVNKKSEKNIEFDY